MGGHLAASEQSSSSLALFLLLPQSFHFHAPGCQLSLPPGFLPARHSSFIVRCITQRPGTYCSSKPLNLHCLPHAGHRMDTLTN